MNRVRVKIFLCLAIAVQVVWLLWGLKTHATPDIIDHAYWSGHHEGESVHGKQAGNADVGHVGQEESDDGTIIPDGSASLLDDTSNPLASTQLKEKPEERKPEETRPEETKPEEKKPEEKKPEEKKPEKTQNGKPEEKVDDKLEGKPEEKPEEKPDPKSGEEMTADKQKGTVGNTSEPQTLLDQWNVLYDKKPELYDLLYGNTLEPLDNTTLPAPYLKSSNMTLEYTKRTPYIFNPYPAYNPKVWNSTSAGGYQACDGPNGALEHALVFPSSPNSFVEPSLGSFAELGIASDLCFERQTRLGPYGYRERVPKAPLNDMETLDGHISKREEPDWYKVDWGSLQHTCTTKNAARFKHIGGGPGKVRGVSRVNTTESNAKGIAYRPRTAVLLRSWTARNYTENDKQNIRSLITELSLQTGGEYEVFLLLQLKGRGLLMPPANQTSFNETIWQNVPTEFRNLTVLWSEDQIAEWYPQSPKAVRNVHRSQLFPVQVFAQQHPEFEYFWNWEMDMRYTGHHYDLLDKIAAFSKSQPRKYLWERNERYYIPSFHGTYSEQFREHVAKSSGNQTVWGPVRIEGVEPRGPTPPVINAEDDHYEWGVGEEADYISVAPIFDPVGSKWFMINEVWGFQGKDHTPRRAVIGTHSRLSQKLLKAMHVESLKGNHVASEMGGATIALLHGLKAVYAPTPIFFDRPWNGAELDKFFNAGPKGVSGSHPDSPFSFGQESRFRGSTWYYRATPPQRLYNHWLGWEDGGIGGAKWEVQHGRMCLPAALLHPVKYTNGTTPGYNSSSVAW